MKGQILGEYWPFFIKSKIRWRNTEKKEEECKIEIKYLEEEYKRLKDTLASAAVDLRFRSVHS